MCSLFGLDSFWITPDLSDTPGNYPVTLRINDGMCAAEDFSFIIVVEEAFNTAPVWTVPFTARDCIIDLVNGADFSEDLNEYYSDADNVSFPENFILSLDNSPVISCIYIDSNQYLVCSCDDNSVNGIYRTTVTVTDSNAIDGANGI